MYRTPCASDIVHCFPKRLVVLSYSWDPGPWLFCVAGQGRVVLRGKGCGIWTDGGIGGMVSVVGMRGRQRGAGQRVCSCSICGQEARAWTERMRDDGEKGSDGEQGSRSQRRGHIQVEK